VDLSHYLTTWDILKWVILVLIAGFIGHFGRIMAEAIIKRIRTRHANQQMSSKEGPTQKNIDSLPESDLSGKNIAAEFPVAQGYSDKKMIKSLTKARKKEARKDKNR
jgi:hypothetical protein